MIGEMYEKLPVELVMHILKFTPHPLVEVMQVGFRTDPYMICDFCENAIFLKTGKWSCQYTENMICGTCYVENAEELEREFKRKAQEEYEEYMREQEVDLEGWGGFVRGVLPMTIAIAIVIAIAIDVI
jgi:superfamily II helicase